MRKKKKGKVVIADDCREICELLQIALGQSGYSVDIVFNGYELLAYLKKNQDVDAVILDLVMPGKGGISVFETVRSISPASKLIIYTGHTDYRDSIYGREADAFIEKTEGVEKILEILEKLL